jgi:TIR domain-containing protein
MSGDQEPTGGSGGSQSEPDKLRIFLNYRREDTRPYARLLYDALRQRWPDDDQVFLDLDRISAGLDFAKAISLAVGSCDVLIAVIGSRWLSVVDAETGENRLQNHDDYVRLEIEAALNRDVRVIPVLVAGGVMPTSRELPQSLAPLTRRNALEMSDTHWDYDIDRLLDALSRIEREKRASLEPQRAKEAAEDERRTAAAAAAAAAEAASPVVSGPPPVVPPPEKARRAPRVPRSLHSRRRWLIPALLAAVAVAAGVTAAVLLLGGGDDKSGAGGTTAQQSPSRGLAAVIPRPLFRNSCKVQPAVLEGAVESAVCTPPASSAEGRLPLYPSSWDASSFSSAATLGSVYDSLRRQNDIGQDFGRCDGASWGGEGEWFHGPGKPGGRRFCYFEGNVAVIVWSHAKLGQESHIDMIGTAREGGSDHATLYTWWRFWHHRIGKCQEQGCTVKT